jgi:hypothetical protein
MSVSQKFVVRHVGPGFPLQVVGGGTTRLSPDCKKIEWAFEDLPAGFSPDIDIRGSLPFKDVSRGSDKVTMSGPAAGPSPRVFSFRACASNGKAGHTQYSEWRDIVVSTPANERDAAGDLIVVRVSLDREGQGRVDMENIVLLGGDLRVRWDLSALQATNVGIKFSGPAGAEDRGPFQVLEGNGQVLTGMGNSGVFGHYEYWITADLPARKDRAARQMKITIDPGIDNVPPPPAKPPQVVASPAIALGNPARESSRGAAESGAQG